MARLAESGSRAHRSRPVHVLPSALVAAAVAAAGPGASMGGTAARLLAPQLRGSVSPRTLRTIEQKGFRVHRVGRAAYAHGFGFHWILAVRDPGEPDWWLAGRLGRVSEGYLRRCERLARETRHLEMARVRGRFAGRLPWHRVRPVRAYRWDPEPRSWLELITARAEINNRRVRQAAGLEWPDGHVATWYPEAGGALDARTLDGDR